MTFNLIRTCRLHALKMLSNEYLVAENNFGLQNLFSRNNCFTTALNPNYRKLDKTSLEEEQKCYQKFFGGHHFLMNYGAITTATPTHCPLRISFPLNLQLGSNQLIKFYSTGLNESGEPQLSNKDKLKRAVKEYGVTVVIFHVSISLISLGSCYLAVSSGLNIADYVGGVGLNGSSEIATEAGLFVVAYAVHKVLAPVRIGITLAATPIIVRYLRKINVLKPPKPS